jgi:hypothetical protein
MAPDFRVKTESPAARKPLDAMQTARLAEIEAWLGADNTSPKIVYYVGDLAADASAIEFADQVRNLIWKAFEERVAVKAHDAAQNHYRLSCVQWLGRDLLNERWVIVSAACLVDAPGHRPKANAIIGRRLQNLHTRSTRQPRLEISRVEQHRHTVVNRLGQGVGIRDDDRARNEKLSGLGAPPPVPQTRKA